MIFNRSPKVRNLCTEIAWIKNIHPNERQRFLRCVYRHRSRAFPSTKWRSMDTFAVSTAPFDSFAKTVLFLVGYLFSVLSLIRHPLCWLLARFVWKCSEAVEHWLKFEGEGYYSEAPQSPQRVYGYNLIKIFTDFQPQLLCQPYRFFIWYVLFEFGNVYYEFVSILL